jgi:hypothetical protein
MGNGLHWAKTIIECGAVLKILFIAAITVLIN